MTGFHPFRGPVTAITIDADGLRALTARHDRVVAWASAPLPPGLVVGGRLIDPSALGGHLREFARAHRLPTGRLTSLVTGFQAVARLIRLPLVPTAEITAALHSEARRQLSLPLDTLAISWQLVARTAEALSVYLVAVPRDLLDGHLAAWHAAGLRLRALDLKPLALARAVGVGTGAIVNVEADSLDLIILIDGLPAIVRTIPLPQLPGSPSLALDIVTDEVYRTTKYYDDSHKDAPLPRLAPIVVTGEVARSDSVIAAIARRSDRPTMLGTPRLIYPDDFPATTFVAAAGLVLKTGLGIRGRT